MNTSLSTFLRDLANDIDTKKASEDQIEIATQLYISDQFRLQKKENTPVNVKKTKPKIVSKRVSKRRSMSESNDYPIQEEFSPEECMRFILMGWHVYGMLIRNSTLI